MEGASLLGAEVTSVICSNFSLIETVLRNLGSGPRGLDNLCIVNLFDCRMSESCFHHFLDGMKLFSSLLLLASIREIPSSRKGKRKEKRK